MHALSPSRLAASFLIVLCCASAGTPPASADTIYWDMQTLVPTVMTESGISATSLSQGNTSFTGTSTQSVSTGYTFSLDGTTTPASGGSNLVFRAAAGPLSLATSAYVELSVSNTSAVRKFLTGFGFGSRSTASGPQAYSMLASTDAFQTHESVGTGALLVDSAWAYKSHEFVTPLSLAANTSLTFRLYAYGGTLAANGNWRLDDLQVMAVPEPAAAGFASLLAVIVVAAARHGRRRAVSLSSRT